MNLISIISDIKADSKIMKSTKNKKSQLSHPDDKKKLTARRKIEDIEAQRKWEKDWGCE